MPRPNKPREVFAEENLALRVANERDARGWSNEGLAKRMTDVGCAMTGSAIFKIEKGSPRRRISVDELVAFAKVFATTPVDLLSDPYLVEAQRVAPLLDEYRVELAVYNEVVSRMNEISHEIAKICKDSELAKNVMSDYFDQAPGEAGQALLAELLTTPDGAGNDETWAMTDSHLRSRFRHPAAGWRGDKQPGEIGATDAQHQAT